MAFRSVCPDVAITGIALTGNVPAHARERSRAAS